MRHGSLDSAVLPLPLELLAALVLCVEARRAGPHIGGRRQVERRRSARAQLTMPVTVVEHGGATWQSASIDLSVFGMKLPPGAAAPPAEHRRPSLTPPDGGPRPDPFAVLVPGEPP